VGNLSVIWLALRWQINRTPFTKDDVFDEVVEIVFRNLWYGISFLVY
jgi:hypothetical protein